ncbi:MAG: hypothetical protein AB7J28_07495 [Hyphomonadaceae bacterium]
MDAWFSPEIARGFAFLALLALLSTTRGLARRGRHRALVTSLHVGAAGLGLALLGLAAAAWSAGKPSYVIFTLALSGAVIFPVCAWGALRIMRVCRDAELRSTLASDL